MLFPVLAQGAASGGSNQIGSLILLGWCVIFLPIPLLLSVLFGRRQKLTLAPRATP